MIQFRCWYCNKRFSVQEQRIGERLTCTCKNPLRIPKYNDGNCRVRTPVDWLVETVVFGGFGGLLGLGLALLILSQFRGLFYFGFRMSDYWGSLGMIFGLTLLGFLIGLLGGERGINWIGRMIRDQENK